MPISSEDKAISRIFWQVRAKTANKRVFEAADILPERDDGGQRRGGGNADVTERLHQQQGKNNVGNQYDDGIFDGRFGVAAGKKLGASALTTT